jgi:glycosyltransferase involved in cell wall biosynthesis
MIQIAFLTPEYPHPRFKSSGGIGTSIMNLSKGLVEKRHKVVLLVYGQEEDAIFEEDGILFYSIKNQKLKGLSWYLTRKKIEKLINKLHEEQQIDIVEAPDWTGITSFIRPKCPIIIRENGSDTYFCHLDHRKVKFVNRFHEKQALKKADGLISVSTFTGNLTNKLFGLSRKFAVIPNAIDTHFFENNSEVVSNRQNILYFGSLIRKKGLLEIPFIFNQVIEKNPDATLTLIGRDVSDIISGSSSTWEMMQKSFSKKALQNVSYLGSVDYDKIKNAILQSSVCIFPSFAEALPVSWLEAMALKKAVVASNVGWASEIIDDGIDGFLVDPKNHEKYGSQICTLLDSQELQNEFGKNARRKIEEKFSIDVVLEQNIEFYKKQL